MYKIKKIVDKINEELDDAKSYIKMANKYKMDDEEIYNLAIKLAQVELEHALSWHDLAVNEVNKAKNKLVSEGKEIPKYMSIMWNETHEEYVECYSKLKYEIETSKK